MLFAFLHFPPFPTELGKDNDGDSVHTPIMLCAHFSLGLYGCLTRLVLLSKFIDGKLRHGEGGNLSPGCAARERCSCAQRRCASS